MTAPSIPLTSGSARRAVWVILDQALASLTNFGLSVVVLRSVDAVVFGAFTLAITTYMIILHICRSLGGEPQVIRFDHAADALHKGEIQAVSGLSLAIGLLGTGVLLALAAVGDGLVFECLAALAVVLPGLLVQDSWRYAFFAAGKPRMAFTSDLVWAVAQAVFTGWALVTGYDSAQAFLLAWGGGATVAAAYGMLQTRCVPRVAQAITWLRLHWDLAPRFAAEFLLDRGGAQIMLFGIGALAGLGALGTLNAARVILGPYNIIVMGAIGFAAPEGVRLLRTRPEVLVGACRLFAIVLGAVALAVTAACLLIPDRIGRNLLGSTWPSAKAILPLTGLYVAAAGASQGPRTGLRVLAAARDSLKTTSYLLPVVIGTGVIGAAVAQAPGAAAGIAFANILGLAVWWRQFKRSAQAAFGAPNSSSDRNAGTHVDLSGPPAEPGGQP